MKKVSFAPVIYERFKTKDGKYPIKLRVTYNQKPTYISTGLYADPNDLYLTSHKSNIPIKNNTLKLKVIELVSSYEEAAAKYFFSDTFPEFSTTDVVDYLKKAMSRGNNFRLNFVEYSNSFIEKKKEKSTKSAKNYLRAVNLLCEFMRQQEFDISMLSSSNLRCFEEYLRNKYSDNARTVSLATSHIRTIHLSAQKKYNSEEIDELNIRNPYDYYTPPRQTPSKHRAINPELIQGMIDDYSQLKGQERVSVGLYLLSFALMGMNSPDIYECQAPINGILHYERHKTRERRDDNAAMEVKIPKCIDPLIKEYKDPTKKKAFIFSTRYCSYTNMEDAETKGMKSYRKRKNITEPIPHYSARHTWATIARSNKCNISMDLIDECLAHVGSHRMGDLYATKDYSVQWKANEKVLSTLNWEPLNI